jgi:Flp pilus assembly protein TadD
MTTHGLLTGEFPRAMRCVALSTAGATALMLFGCASSPPKPATSPVTITQAAPADQSSTSVESDIKAQADNSSPTTQDAKKSKAKSRILAKSFDDAVSRGDNAWLQGDANMAIYLYVQALSFRPTDATTLTKIAVIEQHTDNLPLAARAYELAAKASPDDARISAQLGLVYLALGQDDSARPFLLRSVDTPSADWRVYDALGIVETRRGDNAAALVNLRRAQELAPALAAPLLHQGQAMFAAGDYAGAEVAVRQALKLQPSPEAWQLLGQLQAKRRAYSDSLDSLLEVTDAPAAYTTVAHTALDNGDNAVALRYFEKAATLSPVYLPDAERSANKARERLDTGAHKAVDAS